MSRITYFSLLLASVAATFCLNAQPSVDTTLCRFCAGTEVIAHTPVDLGLSRLWANANVGAQTPYEYGGFYAWGETVTKDVYDWKTYVFCKGHFDDLTKYCTDSKYGQADGKTVLEPCDDAATVNMGMDWRMPTLEEWNELVEKCKWEWDDGKGGYLVTGPSGKSIFLPAGGFRVDSDHHFYNSDGFYWTSTLTASHPYSANRLFFGKNYIYLRHNHRFFGRLVRAVYDPGRKSPQMITEKPPQVTTEKPPQMTTEKSPRMSPQKPPELPPQQSSVMTPKVSPQLPPQMSPQMTTEKSPQPDFTCYVNVFTGSDYVAHCQPAACVPFGNIQAGPQTRSYGWDYCGGYLYDDPTIQGFYQNALNGTGVPDLGDLLLFPFCEDLYDAHLPEKGVQEGNVTEKDVLEPQLNHGQQYTSSYDKKTEKGSPGYYEVRLKDAGVLARMSATEHAAIHEYTYDRPADARLLIDFQNGLVKNINLVSTHIVASEQKLENPRLITGWAHSNVWVDRYYWYAIEFSSPVVSREVLPLRDEREKAPRWVLGFDLQKDEPLKVKVSVSSRSIAGALGNIKSEIPHWSFDMVHSQAVNFWNSHLSRISVEGSEEQKSVFYTTMYHLFTQPSNIADSGERPFYSTFSIWDTYRAVHPLYTIIAPERVDDMVTSMLDIFDRQDCLPVWSLWGIDNWCMIANHSVPVVVDAYLKGFRGFDPERAYRAVKATLTTPQRKCDWAVYDEYGYFPYDYVPKESASKTLECCYDDWCAAQMASALGYTEDAAFFMKRASYWKNLFDPETGLARARDSQGKWRTPFNSFHMSHESAGGGDYTEGNAWQYTWHVQHDVKGLMGCYGSAEAFCRKIDSLFIVDAEGREGSPADIFGGRIGQYVHGNEPSHHVAYLYAMAGQPEKTRDLVARTYRTQYGPGVHGFCGNDDCGQMSAWYIFSTLGFYPVNPCGGEYVIGAPQTSKAVLQLEGGRTFTVIAENFPDVSSNVPAEASSLGATESNPREASVGSPHVVSVTLNGKSLDSYVIRHEDIMRGGTLVFTMGE